MVGANKILTVSYGTFSCTLEGFDEPFNTMKAIAEYFRDLAADDRYFGAEPPQPDAEMLHRIAEREIQRRVEAKIQENGVILRQQDTLLGAQPEADETPEAEQADALVAEAPVEEAAAPEVETTPEPEIAPEVAAEVEPVQAEEIAAEEAPIEVAADTVAAKLQRIREAVARARAAQSDAMMEEDEPASEPAAFLAASEADASSEVEDFGYELDISGPLHDEDVAEADVDVVEPVEDAPVVVEDEIAAPEAAEIEAPEVEAADAELDDADDGEDEVEVAEADDGDAERRQATRRARRAAKRAKRIAALKAAAEAEIASFEIEEDDDQLDDEAEAAEIEEPGAETPEPVIAEVEEVEEVVAEQAEAPVEAEAEAEPVAEEMAVEPEAIEEEPVAEEMPVAPEAPALRARVIKVRRREVIEATAVAAEELAAQDMPVETAEADDDLSARLAAELGTEAPKPQAEVEATDPGALSPEAEADLMRELAALEMEDEPVAEEPVAEVEAEPAETEEVTTEQPEVDLSALVLDADDAVTPDAIEAEAEPVSEEVAEPETAEAEAPEVDLAAQDVLVLGNAIIEPVEETAEDDQPEILALEDEVIAEDEDESAETLEADAVEPEMAEDAVEEAAELEEDFAEEFDEDLAEDEAPAIAAREIAPPAVPDADREAEMDRLLAEADKQAEGVETRRRFSAIAHLKAAVAATVADRLSKGQDTATGGAADEEDGSEPYRADLTQAVRPRRPSNSGEAHARRPEPMRPAPLVLVSEQRVDEASEAEGEAASTVAPAASIRPRRVSAAQIAAAEDAEVSPIDPQQATSFAEFAESLGTQGLSDLLEAAAAYTAAVEGRPHFSPPQIMRKLAAMDETADVPREERMRVFGRLLRQGKITKVKRGQYAITEASRYWDEAKVASGQ